MKRISQILGIVLTFSMIFSLVSCSGGGDSGKNGSTLSVTAGGETLAASETETSSSDPSFTLGELSYIALGTVISFEFAGELPSSVTLLDYVLSADGHVRYYDEQGAALKVAPEFTYDSASGAGSLILEANFAAMLSSDLADYESGAVTRGFLLTASYDAENSSTFEFALSTDAGEGSAPGKMSGIKHKISGTSVGVAEFCDAYNAHGPAEPFLAEEFVNITPSSMASSKYTIFKNALNCAAYAFDGTNVTQLGQYYGGSGLMSVIPCSFGGGDEFLFTYSFGSGTHNSYVSWFADGVETQLSYTVADTELMLIEISPELFYICTADVAEMQSYADLTISSTDYVAQVISDGNGAPMSVVVVSE